MKERPMEESPKPAPVERMVTGIGILDIFIGAGLAIVMMFIVGGGISVLTEQISNRVRGMHLIALIVICFAPGMAVIVTAVAGFLLKKTYKHFGMAILVTTLVVGIPVLGGLAICTYTVARLAK